MPAQTSVRFRIFAKHLSSLVVMPLLLIFNNQQMFTQGSCQILIILNYLDGLCYCIPKPQACSATQHGLGELTGFLSHAVQPDVLTNKCSSNSQLLRGKLSFQ